MLERLREFFRHLGTQDFTQDHNEAIIDLLVWMMRADGELEIEENDKINEFLASVEWTAEHTPRGRIADAVAAVKEIEDGKRSGDAWLKEIAAKLHGDEIRYKAIKVCQELALADGYLDKAETSLLKRYQEALL